MMTVHLSIVAAVEAHTPFVVWFRPFSASISANCGRGSNLERSQHRMRDRQWRATSSAGQRARGPSGGAVPPTCVPKTRFRRVDFPLLWGPMIATIP